MNLNGLGNLLFGKEIKRINNKGNSIEVDFGTHIKNFSVYEMIFDYVKPAIQTQYSKSLTIDSNGNFILSNKYEYAPIIDESILNFNHFEKSLNFLKIKG